MDANARDSRGSGTLSVAIHAIHGEEYSERVV